MVMVARRMDRVVRDLGQPHVPVMPTVFGLTTGWEGPAWLCDPSAQVRAAFWDAHRDEIARDARVWAAIGRVDAAYLVDAAGRPVRGLRGAGALFLVDPTPDANWGHPCRWILVDDHGEEQVLDHDLPPGGDVRLAPLRRP